MRSRAEDSVWWEERKPFTSPLESGLDERATARTGRTMGCRIDLRGRRAGGCQETLTGWIFNVPSSSGTITLTLGPWTLETSEQESRSLILSGCSLSWPRARVTRGARVCKTTKLISLCSYSAVRGVLFPVLGFFISRGKLHCGLWNDVLLHNYYVDTVAEFLSFFACGYF